MQCCSIGLLATLTALLLLLLQLIFIVRVFVVAVAVAFFHATQFSSSVQRPATPRHSCACQLAFGHLRSELAFVIHESENAGRKQSKSYIFYLFTHSFVVFHNFCFSFISALALHAANLERIDNRVWQGSLGVCCQLNFSNCLHFYALFLR